MWSLWVQAVVITLTKIAKHFYFVIFSDFDLRKEITIISYYNKQIMFLFLKGSVITLD